MDRRKALKLMGASMAVVAMAGIAEGWPGERNPEARYRHPKVTLTDIVWSNKQ